MEITDKEFKEKVIEKSKQVPVLVDFWADWCGPCRMFSPILEKVGEDYKGKVEIAKVNVDANPESSDEYGVNAIPAIKLFKDGKVIAQFEGLKPEPALKEWLDENL